MDVKWQVTELPELRAEEEEEPGWQRCRLGKAVEKRKTYNLSKVWLFFFMSVMLGGGLWHAEDTTGEKEVRAAVSAQWSESRRKLQDQSFF